MATSEREVGTRGAASRRLQLVVFWGEETAVFDLPLQGDVSIGRAEDNDVRIENPSVSRKHALLRIDDVLSIEDLGGSNGTCVKDARASRDPTQTQGVRRLARARAEVAVGDSILLGTVCAVLRHVPEPPAHFPDPGDEPDANSERPNGVVLRDPAMRAVYAEAYGAARATISVLILGETGVGKELLARAIHGRSPRAGGPFVSVNCAAFSESLLEAELFGYERGAFTGARDAREGLFEAANGGTLFLDEVGEATQATQAKLLRVVEERAVTRIGARRPRAIDVRIVSATNRDPIADSESGRFRKDLYFRLGGVVLTVPPLRQRPSDIEPLARAFAAAACSQLERGPVELAPETLERLQAYAWPGNVRELRNVIERAVILCADDRLREAQLPPAVRDATPLAAASADATHPRPPEVDAASFKAEVKALDRERIVEALERASGNQTRAAQLLGISRRTLVSRLHEFDLPRPRKRNPR
ncbi:MAG TPA: sigma 54-interacting transcriptional regulator [Polyangiaceae bacterium]|nr:sigma 54-interacting transcriptional regulator [Polyangiaceae bacterium]